MEAIVLMFPSFSWGIFDHVMHLDQLQELQEKRFDGL